MTPTREEIRSWMVTYLADLLDMQTADVSTSTSFEVYGLDSTAAAGMSADLSDFLGVELDADIAYELPTIDAVLDYLMQRLSSGPAPAD